MLLTVRIRLNTQSSGPSLLRRIGACATGALLGVGLIVGAAVPARASTGSSSTASTSTSAPAITSSAATTFVLGSSSAFSVTTTGSPTAALTETGALPGGVAFQDNANGTATLGGTPAAATGGSYPITITASNTVSPAASQDFVLTVAGAIVPADVAAVAAEPNGTVEISGAGTAPGWHSLGGDALGAPAVAAIPTPNGLYTPLIFEVGTSHGLYARTLSSGWQPVGLTSCYDSPAAVVAGGKLYVACDGLGHALYMGSTTIPTNGALPTVTNSQSLGGVLSAGPAIATWNGVLTFFTTGTNDRLYTRTLAASYVEQPETCIGHPAAGTSPGAGGVTYVACQGTGSTMWAVTSRTGYASPVNYGGILVNGPGVAATSAGPIFLSQGTTSFHQAYLRTPAVKWQGLGGTFDNGINGASLDWAANSAPGITSAPAATFVSGQSGTFTVTTSGFPVSSLTEAGSLPAGVTFTDNGNGTATLAGTPGLAAGGNYAFTITAANGNLPNATQSFTLTVDQKASITSTPSVTFTARALGAFTVTTSGFPAPALTEAGALPTGVRFVDNGTGTATLAGTPAPGTGGVYQLLITAHNGVGATATQNFALTVSEAPAITSSAATTFTTGQPGTFTVTATGYPGGPAVAISELGILPNGVTFTDNANGTATLAGTPAIGSDGPNSLLITASNGISPDAQQSFVLTIDQSAAITSPNTTTFATGQAGTFSVTTTGFPTASISESGALPSGVTFSDNSNGTAALAGTPGPGTAGNYPVIITAHNGIGSDASQAFVLVVNNAPEITSASATTFTTGSPGSFTVTTNGFPAGPTIAISEVGALPSGVTLTDNDNATATLAGTPAAGLGGTYSFVITASDGLSPPVNQSFVLTVDQPPLITSAAATTFTTGAAGSFEVTTTGFPNATLSETGALPTGVSFADNGDGTATLSGTPAAGSGGTYQFVVLAQNGVSPSDTEMFTLTVNTGIAITSAAATTFTTGLSGSFTVTTSGFPTASLFVGNDGPSPLPSGVTFTDNANGTATLAGTPDPGTGGTYTFYITAANDVSPPAYQSFTLTVDQPAAVTSDSATTFTVGQPGSFTVSTSGYPNSSLTETGALPSGVSFVDNNDGTATLSGTPLAGTGGTYTLVVTAANGVGTSATQSFTLTVGDALTFTSSANTTFTTGVAGSFAVTTAGFPNASISEQGLPDIGVSFTDNGNGTATLAGTPSPGTGGTYAFTITASNGVLAPAMQTFTLTVDQLPAITSGIGTFFTEGTPGSFEITTSGYPTSQVFEVGPLPSGVTFTDNGDGSATIVGTPAAGSQGTYHLTITAANGLSPRATQLFTLTVRQIPTGTSTVVNDATSNLAWTGTESSGATAYDTSVVTPLQTEPLVRTDGPVGPQGFTPTGTVTYLLFGNNSCEGTATTTDTETLVDGSVPQSSTTAPLSAGSYSYGAVYSGDLSHFRSAASCEPFTVAVGSSSVSTTVYDATSSAAWAGSETTGSSSYDTSIVSPSGSIAPTGTVEYDFFGQVMDTVGDQPAGDIPTGCIGTATTTDTETINGDGSVPNSTTSAPLAAGTYSYEAVYSGDSNYAGSTADCETLVVASGTSTVATTVDDASTQLTWDGTETTGASAYDTSVLTPSGGITATGTVAYDLYGSNDCTGTAATTDTEILNGDGTVPNSTTTAPLGAGPYSFQAVYSGDANYATSTAPCESFSVDIGTSTIATTVDDSSTSAAWTATETTGASADDTSVVTPSAGIVATGTVAYSFFGNDTCTDVPTTTDTEILNSDGTVPSSTTTAPLAEGSYSYEAVYSGDPNYTTSTGPCENFSVAIGTSSAATTVNDASRNEPWAQSGNLDVFAGTGYYGNGPPAPGPATDANLSYAEGTAVDSHGNVYIADTGHNVVEKVDGVRQPDDRRWHRELRLRQYAGGRPGHRGEPVRPDRRGCRCCR